MVKIIFSIIMASIIMSTILAQIKILFRSFLQLVIGSGLTGPAVSSLSCVMSLLPHCSVALFSRSCSTRALGAIHRDAEEEGLPKRLSQRGLQQNKCLQYVRLEL